MTIGFNVSEAGHIVNVIPPIDITGGVNGDRFTMENYGHASIIVQVGVSAAAFTKIELWECNAATGGVDATDNVKIAYRAYKEETASGDTLDSGTSAATVTTAGVTPSANDNIFYVLEVDAAQLSDGFPFLELRLTNGVNSVIASAVAILSGSRYANAASPTALA